MTEDSDEQRAEKELRAEERAAKARADAEAAAKPGPAPNTLEVGLTDDSQNIVINHPDLQPDEHGVGHIVFSVAQARSLIVVLQQKIGQAIAAQGFELRSVEGDPELSELDYPPISTLCVECGFGVRVDEDGCCTMCGATAMGKYGDIAAEAVAILQEALTKTKELDCGDNSCRYVAKGERKGMRTNGGCRCHETPMFHFIARRMLVKGSRLFKA
jgi:hypothetical protein